MRMRERPSTTDWPPSPVGKSIFKNHSQARHQFTILTRKTSHRYARACREFFVLLSRITDLRVRVRGFALKHSGSSLESASLTRRHFRTRNKYRRWQFPINIRRCTTTYTWKDFISILPTISKPKTSDSTPESSRSFLICPVHSLPLPDDATLV